MDSMFFRTWNQDSDVLAIGKTKIATPWDVQQPDKVYFHQGMISTDIGIFYETELDYYTVSCEEVAPNGNKEIDYKTICVPRKLILDNGNTTLCVLEDVWVWENKYYQQFMVVTLNPTKQIFLIDSRGILFELPTPSINMTRKIEFDNREGCYWINGVKVKFRSYNEQVEFTQSTRPIYGALLNKQFNGFIRNNAKNYSSYLYLTAGDSKCGAFISFFMSNGMQCETIPNILCDDETINVRIPLTSENAKRKDVQFLCAKYDNTFSIYGLPYDLVAGGFSFPEKHRNKMYEYHFKNPKSKEIIVFSILNTLRAVCDTNDDYEVFKKTILKIIRLFTRGGSRQENNIFKDVLLLHPDDIGFSIQYVKEKAEYIIELINQYIKRNNSSITAFKAKMDPPMLFAGDTLQGITRKYISVEKSKDLSFEILYEVQNFRCDYSRESYDKNFYMCAYVEARNQFKELMQNFEADTIRHMTDQGVKISKWKNESTLFSIVVKEYPDAIYQYHCEWLGLQSLDIYIPSLKIGIEYQGEQHYHPVDFFGGKEAFDELVKRDKKKAVKCKEHGVEICYWRYDEVISKNELTKRLADILSSK